MTVLRDVGDAGLTDVLDVAAFDPAALDLDRPRARDAETDEALGELALAVALDAGDAEARVTWPDGEVGSWQPIDVNGFVVIDREPGG